MNRVLVKIFVFLISLCLYSCGKEDNNITPDNPDLGIMNLDFERRSNYNTSLPDYWDIGGDGFQISLDDQEKYSGNFSLKMEMKGNPNGKFGVFSGALPIETFAGKNVEYKGWIKTKGVKNGNPGLYFRAEDVDNRVQFDQTYNRGLNGDNDWTQVSIKMAVNPNAIDIYFGGVLSGEGTVWFDKLELFINGVKYIDPEPKTTLSQEEITALKKYIYPLRTYEPDGGDTKDLDALNMLIGSSKVVALGEVSHGSSEIFKMKNRIIQYLAVNHGFDIFSIEAAMPESYKLNDYTIRGEGDPKKLIAGMHFWTWRTEEVLNMVEWMHKFNQPKQRIEFTGFDMQSYTGAINEFSDAFKGNDELENKIAGLLKILAKTSYGNINISGNEKKELDTILSLLQESIEASSFQTSYKIWLQQNIVIIQQYLGYNDYNRDKCMADNFIWIKEHNPNSKLVIWAHNGHIQKTNKVMGYHLAQKLAENYTTFGFTFFDGSFTAAGSKGLTSYIAAQADPGKLEYFLNQLNEAIFVLDMKKIKSDKPKNIEWLLERLSYRSVGSVGGGQYEFKTGKISDDFDYLIFIKTSTPSVLLPNS